MSGATHSILIDGSYYVYSSHYGFSELKNHLGQPTGGIYGFTKLLLSLATKFPAANIAVVFDAPFPCFRNKLYPAYKLNRDRSEDLSEQFKFCSVITSCLGLKQYIVKYYEGDDVIGTLSRILLENNSRVTILSRDKDLLQLVQPGVSVFRNKTTINIDNFQRYFGILPGQFVSYLALCGDTVDNIPGVMGIGPVRAKMLLNTYGTIANIMDNLTALPKHIAAKLLKDVDNLYLSHQLATIDVDVPLELDDNFLAPGVKSYTRLLEVFEQLNFQSLIPLLQCDDYREGDHDFLRDLPF